MTSRTRPHFALVGPGSAGTAIARALVARGWRAVAVAGRAVDAPSTRRLALELDASAVETAKAGNDARLVVIAVPDDVIGAVAASLAPDVAGGTLVIHLSGAWGLDALGPLTDARADVRVGALHPLQTFPSGESDPARLHGAWAAVSGVPEVADLAVELGMQPFVVDDASRACYHAAASIASNHLVALLAQVERLAAATGVPFEAFLPLVRAAVDAVAERGAAEALTGPVARGDVGTVTRHLTALRDDERELYRVLADAARRIAGRDDPSLTSLLGTASAADSRAETT